MAFLDKLNTVPDHLVKEVFKELLQAYLHPAYGSMPKRDFDIMLFSCLQKLELIPKNPSIYEVVTNLRVTRSKARNFIYEVNLRRSSLDSLDVDLKNFLKAAIFIKDADKRIGIEIDNPLLIDHLRSKLKTLNHLTDGSFSPELIKLTPEAYTDLVLTFLGSDEQKRVVDFFREKQILTDTSAKGILKSILKKLGEKVAGKAADELVDKISDYVSPILSNRVEEIESKLISLFKKE